MATTTAAPATPSRLRRPARGTPRRALPRLGLRWISPLAILAVWQLASSAGLLDEQTLASPVQCAQVAWTLIENGQLPDAILASLERAALGFLLGTAVALVLGGVAGAGRLGAALVDPPMQMVRTIPLFGLVPLFILWFGIGEASKVLLIALGVVVPLYLNLVAALRDLDPELDEVAASLRLTRWERLRHLVVPGVLPGALVGVRQSLGVAWLALIVAEQVNTNDGLGFLINNARDFLRTDVIVVGLLAYAVLGLLTDWVVRRWEARALRWRQDAPTARAPA